MISQLFWSPRNLRYLRNSYAEVDYFLREGAPRCGGFWPTSSIPNRDTSSSRSSLEISFELSRSTPSSRRFESPSSTGSCRGRGEARCAPDPHDRSKRGDRGRPPLRPLV